MRVVVLPPKAWRPLIDTASADLLPRQRRSLHTILAFLHGRHLGVAPRLAADLVPLLNPSARLNRTTVWNRAIDQLHQSLLPDNETGRPPPAVILPGVVPGRFLERFVAPMVLEAQRRTNLCVLFGGEGHAPVPFRIGRADSWQTDQILAFDEIIADETIPPAFWRVHGVELAAMSRDGRTETVSIPDFDRRMIDLLMELDPVLPDSMPPRRRTPQTPTISPHSVIPRPQEGGIEGIRTAYTFDEVGDKIQSEHMRHRVERAQRDADSEFLINNRPPKRQPRRDMLIAGVMPHGCVTPAARLAKAAWIDAMARIAPLLQEANLAASDFLWLDGDSLAGMRSSIAPLPQVKLPRGRDWALTPSDRMRFVWVPGWLPGLVDRSRAYEAGIHPPSDPPANPPAAAATWALGMLSRCLGVPGQGPFSDYAKVHICVFLPGRAAPDTDSPNANSPETDFQTIVRSLRLEAKSKQSAGLTIVPARIADATGWRVVLPERGAVSPVPPEPDDTDATLTKAEVRDMISGSLVAIWLEFLQGMVLDD